MLENLVESKSDRGNAKNRGSYLFTTSLLVFSVFASGILWSLFAKNLEISGELELSSIVAPVQIAAEDPPPPEVVREVRQQNTTAKVDNNVIVRKENLANVDEPIAPKDISVRPNTGLSRPKHDKFQIGTEDSTPGLGAGGPETNRRGDGKDVGVIKNQVQKPEEVDNDPPPVMPKKPDPTPTPRVEPKETPKPPTKTTVVSQLLNGRATYLPKPNYPPQAKLVGAKGDVSVQITIDETGRVISANAISGHPFLKHVSEQAARAARFDPTILNGQPVKVTGIIVYKFAVE